MASSTTPLASVNVSIEPVVVDLECAARMLAVSYWTVRDLVDAGKLPVVKLANARGKDMRRILIAVEDIRALVARSKESR